MKAKRLVLVLCILLLNVALFAIKVGDLAPDFSATLDDGTKITLSDYKGQPVFLNFWATWCPPCIREMPGIQKLYQELDQQDSKLKIITICISDTKKNRDDFLSKNGYTFLSLIDQYGNIAAFKYGLRGTPSSFLIDAEGKIIDSHVGMMTEKQLWEFVKDVR